MSDCCRCCGLSADERLEQAIYYAQGGTNNAPDAARQSTADVNAGNTQLTTAVPGCAVGFGRASTLPGRLLTNEQAASCAESIRCAIQMRRGWSGVQGVDVGVAGAPITGTEVRKSPHAHACRFIHRGTFSATSRVVSPHANPLLPAWK